MAILKLIKLRELIKKSYEAGYNGCMELADEFVEEMITEIQEDIKNSKSGAEWRVYTVEELKKCEVGTMFEHSRLGQGWIESGGISGCKYMKWNSGEMGFLVENIEPWDEPMREVAKI